MDRTEYARPTRIGSRAGGNQQQLLQCEQEHVVVLVDSRRAPHQRIRDLEWVEEAE
jgi:hypothetical protein